MHELTAQLEHHLKVLRLPGILSHYRDLSDQVTQKQLHYEEYLTLVLEAGVKHKQEGSVKNKVTTARFPYVKTTEQFDFSFQPSLNEMEIARLGSLAFIEAKGSFPLHFVLSCKLAKLKHYFLSNSNSQQQDFSKSFSCRCTGYFQKSIFQ